MSRTTPLYELQGVDADIAARKTRLERIQEQLEDDQALTEARQRVAEARQRVSEMERQQRALEQAVEDLRAKIGPVEQKLYGGTVRNPKELTALQEETEHMKARQRREEDRLLDVMGELEGFQSNVATLTGDLEEQEGEWEVERTGLLGEQERLTAELVGLEGKRHALIPRVLDRDLKMYESLLLLKQGRAVVRVERGTCQGCRITLPIGLLQRVRMGEEVVQCGSCERILHLD